MRDVERLFHAHHAALVRYLTRRLGDRDWAEELVQETFLRALRHEDVVNERAWLFAVAANLARDEARRQIRRRRHLQLLADEARAAEAEAPTPAFERAEDAAAARLALDGLEERDRHALLLREEGLSYEEIAEALGLSVGSVGTTLFRARKRLVASYEAVMQTKGERNAS